MDIEDARRLGLALLRKHGLHDWRLVFDQAKARAGVCRFGQRMIGLSAPLTKLHGEDEVRDTILHEIAHAIVGASHGHDAVWRATATAIGCSGLRCVPEAAARVPGEWLGTCPNGHEVTRHRRPTRVLSCTRCASTFTPDVIFRWRHRGVQVRMHPRYEAELASIRRREALAADAARARRPERTPAPSLFPLEPWERRAG